MIYVVHGPPCSGKTTYVSENMKDSDIRFDFDLLAQAVTNCKHREHQSRFIQPLLRLRKAIIDMDIDGDIWIISKLLNARLIEDLGDREHETILMETSKEECLARLEKDDSREDKEFWREIIERYFNSERGAAMNKQYRYIQGELRADEAGHKLSGYFAVFGPEYKMGQMAAERLDPAAFDNTLTDQPDVRCLWNHNPDIVLGRTGNGTLSLRVDDHGLFGEVTINPEDSDAMNALARIRRGDVSQCSFGFEVLEEERIHRDNDVLFVLKDVRLWEVSPVTFPAYRETSISARNDDAAEVKRRDFEAWREKTKARFSNGTKEAVE